MLPRPFLFGGETGWRDGDQWFGFHRVVAPLEPD
jgi:hypothetical protein